MIVAVGVDAVEVQRVQRLLKNDGFVERIYTESERAYCLERARPTESFAARFAAKEAVMKCLGTGWSRGVGFRQVEVQRKASGELSVALTGRALEVSQEREIGRIHLSLSHTAGQAVAFAVAEACVDDDNGGC